MFNGRTTGLQNLTPKNEVKKINVKNLKFYINLFDNLILIWFLL
jgi:hypothetical protein